MADFKFSIEELPENFLSLEKQRLGFIRKVYGILSIQVGITALISYVALIYPPLAVFIVESPGLLLAAGVFSVVIMIVVGCCRKYTRKVPQNYALLGTFTMCESYLIAGACVMYDPVTVVIACFMSLGVTVTLSAYAYTAKLEFRSMEGVTIVVLSSMILFGILGSIFGIGEKLEVVWSTLGVIIYGFYIIYDTQVLAGGGRRGIGLDDYILASLILYVDILGMFIYLLRLVGKPKH